MVYIVTRKSQGNILPLAARYCHMPEVVEVRSNHVQDSFIIQNQKPLICHTEYHTLHQLAPMYPLPGTNRLRLATWPYWVYCTLALPKRGSERALFNPLAINCFRPTLILLHASLPSRRSYHREAQASAAAKGPFYHLRHMHVPHICPRLSDLISGARGTSSAIGWVGETRGLGGAVQLGLARIRYTWLILPGCGLDGSDLGLFLRR